MSKQHTSPRADVGIDTYRNDTLYPRVTHAVEKLLARGKLPFHPPVQSGVNPRESGSKGELRE
jgi:hypothetical protein